MSACGRIGRRKDIRRLRCRARGGRLAEREGAVFYRARMPPLAQVVSILHHVREGCGMRQAGRLTGHKEDAVIHHARQARRPPRAGAARGVGGLFPRGRGPAKFGSMGSGPSSFASGGGGTATRGTPTVTTPATAGLGPRRVRRGEPPGAERGLRQTRRGAHPGSGAQRRAATARAGGRAPRLITSGEFAAYATVRDLVSNDPPRPIPGGPGRHNQRGRGRGRPKPKARPKSKSKRKPTYATVCKRRENGRAVAVRATAVFGSRQSAARAPRQSRAGRAVNTAFLGRHGAAARRRNARKARQAYRSSKDWDIHQAVTHFSRYPDNFCRPVRTLRQRLGRRRRRRRPRTPATSARLTDHVWALHEWLARPIPGLST